MISERYDQEQALQEFIDDELGQLGRQPTDDERQEIEKHAYRNWHTWCTEDEL